MESVIVFLLIIIAAIAIAGMVWLWTTTVSSNRRGAGEELSNHEPKDKSMDYIAGKFYYHNNVDSDKLSEDIGFNIGSVTKLFTAAALRIMADAGRIDLGKSWREYADFDIVGFPEKYTVMDIINHKSGLVHDPPRDPKCNWYPDYIPATEVVKSWKDSGVVYTGRDEPYSNAGYQLLGHIIEHVSGKDWFSVMDELIFRPLGMTPWAGPTKMQSYHAYGDFKYRNATEKELAEVYYAASAGGLCVSMTDLLKFAGGIRKLIPDIVERPIYRLGGGGKAIHGGGVPAARCKMSLDLINPEKSIVHFGFVMRGIIYDPNLADIVDEHTEKNNKKLGYSPAAI